MNLFSKCIAKVCNIMKQWKLMKKAYLNEHKSKNKPKRMLVNG